MPATPSTPPDLTTPTARTTPTRYRSRYAAETADLYAVLDAGLIAHLGFVRGDGPVVLPMGYGRVEDTLYLHASSGAGYSDALDQAPVCVTVTLVDAIVYARSVFNHSMNYRCAVVFGTARRVRDADEVWAGLEAVTEHLAPGSWQHARRPEKRELAATSVFALDLAEASVKIRNGPPGDDQADIDAGGRWAGILPLRHGFDAPESAADSDLDVPDHVRTRTN